MAEGKEADKNMGNHVGCFSFSPRLFSFLLLPEVSAVMGPQPTLFPHHCPVTAARPFPNMDFHAAQ